MDEQAKPLSVKRCDDGSFDVLGYLLEARPIIREADQAPITQAVEAINQTLNRQEKQETQMTDTIHYQVFYMTQTERTMQHIEVLGNDLESAKAAVIEREPNAIIRVVLKTNDLTILECR